MVSLVLDYIFLITSRIQLFSNVYVPYVFSCICCPFISFAYFPTGLSYQFLGKAVQLSSKTSLISFFYINYVNCHLFCTFTFLLFLELLNDGLYISMMIFKYQLLNYFLSSEFNSYFSIY